MTNNPTRGFAWATLSGWPSILVWLDCQGRSFTMVPGRPARIMASKV